VVAAGAAAGAVTNLTKQGLHKLTDTPDAGLDAQGLVNDTVVGAATALIPAAKVAGVSAGRNSMTAIAKQVATKFENDQISTVSAKTAARMATGTAVAAAPGTMAAAVNSGIETRRNQQKEPQARQSCAGAQNPQACQ
jgi:hypothetical protein